MKFRSIQFALFFFVSAALSAQQKAVTLPSDTLITPEAIQLPNACDLLLPDSVASIMGIDVRDIMVIDPPKVGEQGVSGCFYKWADESTPHAGIFIQVMKNPAFDSYPEYIENYIDDRIANGEAMPGRASKIKYTESFVNGIRVAWSAEQARLYWTLGKNHLCMLAVNRPGMPEVKLLEVGKIIIQSLNNTLLNLSTVK
jgi:hypothetical protein